MGVEGVAVQADEPAAFTSKVRSPDCVTLFAVVTTSKGPTVPSFSVEALRPTAFAVRMTPLAALSCKPLTVPEGSPAGTVAIPSRLPSGRVMRTSVLVFSL